MKGLPLHFDFEGKGVLDLELLVKNKAFFHSSDLDSPCFPRFGEPTSVLDSGGPTSTSTPSSSHGGAADTNPSPISSNAGRPDSDLLPVPQCLDWENAASPAQDQSIFRWIMGDIGGLTPPELEFGGGFGVTDQFGSSYIPPVSNFFTNTRSSTDFPSNSVHLDSPKQPLFNLMNNPHIQNPSFFQQDQLDFLPPHPKRTNLGNPAGAKWSFPDLRQQEILPGRGRHLKNVHGEEEPVHINHHHHHHHHQQQSEIIDQLYNSVELINSGNLTHAQGILARLNQFLSPTGKPFFRSAFYCKEALHSLLNPNNSTPSPFDIVFKISAYKSFSELSPSVEFANFTSNQALLEAFEGFDSIHVVDFDIGLGGQWAPLMQELAFRGSPPPILKITAVIASHSPYDQIGLCLIRENLIQFATEINLEFEFEVMGIDSLNSSLNSRVSGNEAVAVNLPAGCITDYDLPPPLLLRLVKQLSPRVVVSVDVGCQRTDLPFADHVIHTLHSYSSLLESLDAVNVNTDSLQRIERFLIQPGIEKIVSGRFRAPGKSQHWRNLFLSSGFSQVEFSNFAESQAECVVKRMPVRGFQVEKRQSSLVLCWQRKELASASVWRC